MPADLQAQAVGGVHGEHDVVLHRPVVPGEPLRIWVDGHSARPAGRNAAVTLHYTALDEQHALVAEQWWTTVFFGVACDAVEEDGRDLGRVEGGPAGDHVDRAAPAGSLEGLKFGFP